jgi:hypothetical protein
MTEIIEFHELGDHCIICSEYKSIPDRIFLTKFSFYHVSRMCECCSVQYGSKEISMEEYETLFIVGQLWFIVKVWGFLKSVIEHF